MVEVEVERRQRPAHLLGGAHRPQRIVLAHDRRPPHRHHRVADELRHRAAVGVHRAAHLLVEAVHDPPQRLLVEPLGQRREADQVGE